MGMPRQEHWILDHLDQLPPCVICNVGALMELIAGSLPTPPRWVGRIGLEWLYRLLTNPRRVWRRYLLEPWALLPWLIQDLWNYRGPGGRKRRAFREGGKPKSQAPKPAKPEIPNHKHQISNKLQIPSHKRRT